MMITRVHSQRPSRTCTSQVRSHHCDAACDSIDRHYVGLAHSLALCSRITRYGTTLTPACSSGVSMGSMEGTPPSEMGKD